MRTLFSKSSLIRRYTKYSTGISPFNVSIFSGQAHITEFDDKLVRKLVEKVTVYDDRIVVEFN
jgi:hypothetical protein